MSRIVREKSNFTRKSESDDVSATRKTITRAKPTLLVTNPRITRPQNITSFTPLPSDVMTEFLSNMTCLDLQELKTNNTAFSKFITVDMITKSVNRNYPRLEGKAKVYRIKINPEQPELQFYEDFHYYRNEDNDEFYNIVDKFNQQFPKYKGKIERLYDIDDYLVGEQLVESFIIYLTIMLLKYLKILLREIS